MWELKYIHKNNEKFWVNGRKLQLDYNYLQCWKDSSSNVTNWTSFPPIPAAPTQITNTQPFHQSTKQFHTLFN